MNFLHNAGFKRFAIHVPCPNSEKKKVKVDLHFWIETDLTGSQRRKIRVNWDKSKTKTNPVVHPIGSLPISQPTRWLMRHDDKLDWKPMDVESEGKMDRAVLCEPRLDPDVNLSTMHLKNSDGPAEVAFSGMMINDVWEEEWDVHLIAKDGTQLLVNNFLVDAVLFMYRHGVFNFTLHNGTIMDIDHYVEAAGDWLPVERMVISLSTRTALTFYVAPDDTRYEMCHTISCSKGTRKKRHHSVHTKTSKKQRK
jgi:hypothetical protein